MLRMILKHLCSRKDSVFETQAEFTGLHNFILKSDSQCLNKSVAQTYYQPLETCYQLSSKRKKGRTYSLKIMATWDLSMIKFSRTF